MLLWFWFALYLLLSVSGVLLFKLGTATPIELTLNGGAFAFKIGWLSILGLLCYVCSFLLYMFLISKNQVSLLVPMTTAFGLLLTLAASVFVLREQVTAMQWCGCLLIVMGILVMNWKHIT